MQQNVSANNKRIVKNSLLLYIRTFFVMLISLYTSRVILHVLGVEDYGIYNVVGGIVAMMGILNSAMSVATQRYLTYELGKGNIEKLKIIFSSSLLIYLLLCAILLVLGETVGVWFLNTHLVIPPDRLRAANWVFQLSIVASMNTLLVNPFNACIIAHERMNIYAYVSILEVSLKLLIVYMLPIIPLDRLITYAILILVCQLIITMFYRVYCIKHFAECKIVVTKDKQIFKDILSFSGWNLLGGIATLLKTQGLNIVINMFFPPTVNASRAIAVQVSHAISQFFGNFYVAFRPQITKYYARGDMDNMFRLVLCSTRYSYYLMLLVSLPLLLMTPEILNMWLDQTPPYSIIFTRLILLISIVDSTSHPLMTLAQAIGDLKIYQMVTSTLVLFNVPLSYLFLRMGHSPQIVFWISLSISMLCMLIRVYLVNRLVVFPVFEYFTQCGIMFIVTIVTLIIPIVSYHYMHHNIFNLLIILSLCICSTIISVYILGITSSERGKIIRVVRTKLLKK